MSEFPAKAFERSGRNHPRTRELLATIPGYVKAAATVDHAKNLHQQLDIAARPVSATQWPHDPADISIEWLQAEVTRRARRTETDALLQVVDELINESQQEMYFAIEQHGEQLVIQLASQLDQFVTDAQQLVGGLGSASTASEAIAADRASNWKLLSDMRSDYDDIRRVQEHLYTLGANSFDQLRAGGGGNAADVEARLWRHKNLVTIAPHYAGYEDSSARRHPGSVPWPDDPVEQLVWFIRNDSGIWCPTADDLNRHLEALTRDESIPFPAIPSRRNSNSVKGFTPSHRDNDDPWHTPVEARRGR